MQKPAERPARRGITAARIVGLLGTGIVLATGVAIALMISGTGGSGEIEAATTVAARPSATPDPKARKPARRGLSRRAKAARRAAVADVTAQGYSPVSLKSYRPERALRVLVAAPTGDRDGGRRAFFFYNRTLVGTDTADNSARISVLGAGGERWATLQYRLYGDADEPCCPTGDTATVRFRWDGTSVAPADPLPAPELRAVRR